MLSVKICCSHVCADTEHHKFLFQLRCLGTGYATKDRDVRVGNDRYLFVSQNSDPETLYGLVIDALTTCGRVTNEDILEVARSRRR
jgi:hypothetical protein